MVIYTIMIIVLILSATSLISRHINRSFPNIEDILKHEKKLEKEIYIKLPDYILKHSKILVYDEAHQVIYTNDKDAEKSLKNIDLEFIPFYDYQQYYNVISNTDSQEYKWIVEKIKYEPSEEKYLCVGKCYLDESYHIVSGDILSENGSFSQKELQMMQGTFSEEEMIEKFKFVTNEGESRTLVFISKKLVYSQYEKAEKEASVIWLYILTLIIVLLLLAAMIGSRFAKKSMKPLQDAMDAYGRGESYDLSVYEVPTEYENVVTTFNNLVESLEASQNEKQRMLADISHDLRTPLTVIKGYSQAFMDGVVTEEKSKQYMEVINQKADLCAKLIDTLLIYTKLDHPEYVLNKKEVNISELCLNYLAEKYHELEINNITLDVDVPEKEIFFSCDEEMMIRLFDNIISNTIKYAGGNIELIFHLVEDEQGICIKIADTGQGIPTEIMIHVFDAFIVADETRKSGKGIGLGLSIAKKIVELHGGTISLSDKPERGIGTEFIIKFNL